jgi:hypothetical protein
MMDEGEVIRACVPPTPPTPAGYALPRPPVALLPVVAMALNLFAILAGPILPMHITGVFCGTPVDAQPILLLCAGAMVTGTLAVLIARRRGEPWQHQLLAFVAIGTAVLIVLNLTILPLGVSAPSGGGGLFGI